MARKHKAIFLILGIFLMVMLAAALFIHSHNVVVLNPKGIIGSKERRLIVESTLLMLIVVIPVYISLFLVAWKYREDNQKSVYEPDLDNNRALEILWWAIPGLIITILAVITYRSSYELDPFKPLMSNSRSMTIEVVALQWKWLFIYPDQKIASVNDLQLPINTPINFDITSDAPMNSFWVPQLGGQIYAMSGMSSQLHLEADNPGSYQGMSANISGRGFANMNFKVKASEEKLFSKWVDSVKKTASPLSPSVYSQIAQPGTNLKIAYYSPIQTDLYKQIINKYTQPAPSGPSVDYYVAKANTETR